MSVLADIYVSAPENALAYDGSKEFPENERAELTGFTYIEFSTLWAILEGKPWEEEHMDAFESVMEDEKGEKMIFRFPERVVELAVKLGDAAIESAAEEWAETDELECAPEDLRPVIEELVRVAKVAKESGRGLYLWNSV